MLKGQKMRNREVIILFLVFLLVFIIPFNPLGRAVEQQKISHTETVDFQKGDFSNLKIENGTISLSPDFTQVWKDRFDSGEEDKATSIAVSRSGYAYVVGFSEMNGGPNEDFRIIKYNSEGNVEWNKTFDFRAEDRARDVVINPVTDSIYVAGNVYDEITTHDMNFCLLKIEPYGELDWIKQKNIENDDIGRSVELSSQLDGVYVGGFTNAPPPEMHGYLIKYDFMGNIISEKEIKNIQFLNSIKSPEKNTLIAAGTHLGDSWDFLTSKYEPESNLTWRKTHDGGNKDFLNSLAIDKNQNIYVTGYSAKENPDYYTIKYDQDGNVIWKDRYDSGSDDEARDIKTSTNGTYVTGFTHNGTNLDYLTIKYDEKGNQISKITYDSNSDDKAQGIDIGPSNNVFVTGSSGDGSDKDFLTTMYSFDYESSGRLISDELVSSEENIISASVSWNSSTPQNTSINVEISNDNGHSWTSVENGIKEEFDNIVSSLRYRVTMSSSENLTTPELYDLTINYETKNTEETSSQGLLLPWNKMFLIIIGIGVPIGIISFLKITGKLKLSSEETSKTVEKQSPEIEESPYESTIGETYYGMLKSAAEKKSEEESEVKRRSKATKPFEKEED